jgi:hypothetical protein
VLFIVFAATRTLRARALVGAVFAGFFGATSLAARIGQPVTDHYGADSVFAAAVWAPVTEELLKLLPVAVFLAFALRNRRARPSLGDAVLFGALVGAGFAVYENVLYARDFGGGWFSNLPFSLVIPSITSTNVDGTTMFVGGHLVYTALASLGLGVTLLYRHRARFAWLAAPVAFAVVLLEHACANAVGVTGGDLPAWASLGRIVTLGGYLSTALLLAGVAAAVVIERRAVHAPSLTRDVRAALLPSPSDVARRTTALAIAQNGAQS